MPHTRSRYIEEPFKKIIEFSPLIGILGHRQVGKTTFLEKVSKHYYTLDQRLEYVSAKQNPDKYIAERQNRLVALDECQTVPALFPALKNHVRLNKRPGQFILSGSVRFTSRKAIRESLTGRIINLELLPFTIDELESKPLSSFCLNTLRSKSLQGQAERTPLDNRSHQQKTQRMRKYFTQGGLPGICFIRDEKIRASKANDQLETMLDRDLRHIQKTTLSLQELKGLCATLANSQGVPLDYTRLQRESGISIPTLKKLLYALEAIFLIRILPIEGTRKGRTLYFEDQGESALLRSVEPSAAEHLTHFCFTHIRAQFNYRLGERIDTFQYRTRGGALIPLAYRNSTGTLGIVPVEHPDEAVRYLGSINSFLKSYQDSKVLVVHPEKTFKIIQPRVLLTPVTVCV